MSRVPFVSRSWSEGRIGDLWSLVHFGTGLTGGFANVFFGLSAPAHYAWGLAGMVLWEIIEYVRNIRESPENRVSDIVVGLSGVFVARSIAPTLSHSSQRVAFAISAAALTIGCVLGWRAYRKRIARARGA